MPTKTISLTNEQRIELYKKFAKGSENEYESTTNKSEYTPQYKPNPSNLASYFNLDC